MLILFFNLFFIEEARCSQCCQTRRAEGPWRGKWSSRWGKPAVWQHQQGAGGTKSRKNTNTFYSCSFWLSLVG